MDTIPNDQVVKAPSQKFMGTLMMKAHDDARNFLLDWLNKSSTRRITHYNKVPDNPGYGSAAGQSEGWEIRDDHLCIYRDTLVELVDALRCRLDQEAERSAIAYVFGWMLKLSDSHLSRVNGIWKFQSDDYSTEQYDIADIATKLKEYESDKNRNLTAVDGKEAVEASRAHESAEGI